MKKRIILACSLLLGTLSVIAQSNNANDSIQQQEHLEFVQSLLTNQIHSSDLRNKPTGIQQRLIAQSKYVISDNLPNITDTSVYKYSGKRGSKYSVSTNGESYSWNFQSDFLNCLYNDMTNKLPDVFADSIISIKNGQPKDTFTAFYNAQNSFDSFFYYRNIPSSGYRIMRTTHQYNANGKMTQLKTDYSIDRVNFYDGDLRKFWYNNTNTQLEKDTLYYFSGTTWSITQTTAYHYNAQNYLDSMWVYKSTNDTLSLLTLVNIKYDNEGRITNIFVKKRPQSTMIYTTYLDSLGYTGNLPDYTYFEATTLYQNGDTSNSKVLLSLGSNNLPDSAVQLDLDVSNNTYSPTLYRKFYYNSFNNPDSINVTFASGTEESYHFYYEMYDDTPTPSSIKDINKTDVFSVHPNPFNRQINIDWKAAQTAARISLINGLGQTVFDVRKTLLKGNNSIELPALTNGFYIIAIQNEKGEKFSSKLLKK